ncbi:MAG: hypothetical protein AAFU77_09290 [Myxococcota bacterium]
MVTLNGLCLYLVHFFSIVGFTFSKMRDFYRSSNGSSFSIIGLCFFICLLTSIFLVLAWHSVSGAARRHRWPLRAVCTVGLVINFVFTLYWFDMARMPLNDTWHRFSADCEREYPRRNLLARVLSVTECDPKTEELCLETRFLLQDRRVAVTKLNKPAHVGEMWSAQELVGQFSSEVRWSFDGPFDVGDAEYIERLTFDLKPPAAPFEDQYVRKKSGSIKADPLIRFGRCRPGQHAAVEWE